MANIEDCSGFETFSAAGQIIENIENRAYNTGFPDITGSASWRLALWQLIPVDYVVHKLNFIFIRNEYFYAVLYKSLFIEVLLHSVFGT